MPQRKHSNNITATAHLIQVQTLVRKVTTLLHHTDNFISTNSQHVSGHFLKFSDLCAAGISESFKVCEKWRLDSPSVHVVVVDVVQQVDRKRTLTWWNFCVCWVSGLGSKSEAAFYSQSLVPSSLLWPPLYTSTLLDPV